MFQQLDCHHLNTKQKTNGNLTKFIKYLSNQNKLVHFPSKIVGQEDNS